MPDKTVATYRWEYDPALTSVGHSEYAELVVHERYRQGSHEYTGTVFLVRDHMSTVRSAPLSIEHRKGTRIYVGHVSNLGDIPWLGAIKAHNAAYEIILATLRENYYDVERFGHDSLTERIFGKRPPYPLTWEGDNA